MDIKELNEWFKGLTFDEAEKIILDSIRWRESGVSNTGILKISAFTDSGIRTEHFGEYPEMAMLKFWETLSDEDKSAIRSSYETMQSRPLAPNGHPSNLSPEDWALVRSDKFKAWFGDWENDPEHASRCLDENGEPLLVYHGSSRDFDQFELGHGGDNTGAGEWENKQTGEKLDYDSNHGLFFSSFHDQAVSYSLLSQYHQHDELRKALDGLYPCVNALTNYDFKDREEFVSALRLATEVSPLCRNLLTLIEENPDKIIFREILPKMQVEERKALSDEVEVCRNKQRDICRAMSRGALSNLYHNFARQGDDIRKLKADIIRLAHNDETVKNTFGTFATHSQTIMAGGNDVATFTFDENKRCRFIDEDASIRYLDECSDVELVEIMAKIDRMHEHFGEYVQKELADNNYDKNTVIYECFLNLRNPLGHDYENSPFPDHYKDTKYPTGYIAARQVRRAISDGNDGVVYKNIIDPFKSDTYGVFSSEQVMIVSKQHGLAVADEIHVGSIEKNVDINDKVEVEKTAAGAILDNGMTLIKTGDDYFNILDKDGNRLFPSDFRNELDFDDNDISHVTFVNADASGNNENMLRRDGTLVFKDNMQSIGEKFNLGYVYCVKDDKFDIVNNRGESVLTKETQAVLNRKSTITYAPGHVLAIPFKDQALYIFPQEVGPEYTLSYLPVLVPSNNIPGKWERYSIETYNDKEYICFQDAVSHTHNVISCETGEHLLRKPLEGNIAMLYIDTDGSVIKVVPSDPSKNEYTEYETIGNVADFEVKAKVSQEQDNMTKLASLEEARHVLHKAYALAKPTDETIKGELAKDFVAEVRWSRALDINVPGRENIVGMRYIDFKDCTNYYILYKDNRAVEMFNPECNPDDLLSLARSAKTLLESYKPETKQERRERLVRTSQEKQMKAVNSIEELASLAKQKEKSSGPKIK